MQSLYTNGFETIYDAMYQNFINYKDEYEFYSTLLKQYNKNQVLEIGSGTGNLARYFIKNNFNYTGLDYSLDMVNLASKKNPKGIFIKEDMTSFKLKNTTESIIITGRTTSYLLNNKAINNALQSMHNSLKTNGILCFDFIDATRFFKIIKNGKQLEHNATFNSKNYYRESLVRPTTLNNFMFQWSSKYYEIKEGDKQLIAKDDSEIRAFTKNEWELFLYLNNFELIEFIGKKTYMFDTYVVVAKKINLGI